MVKKNEKTRIAHYMPALMLVAITVLPVLQGQPTHVIETVCPSVCQCQQTERGLVVSCCEGTEKQNKIPSLPEETVEVNLTSCHIEEVPPGVFRNLSKLTIFTMNYGKFQTLPKSAFTGLLKVEMFVMRHGIIERVEKGVFSTLKSLRYLHLENNKPLKLEHIPFILEDLNQTQIKEIHLDGINQFKHSACEDTLREEHLAGLKYINLDIFSFQGCNLRIIDSSVFFTLRNTTCVSFSKNIAIILGKAGIIVKALLSNHKMLVFDFQGKRKHLPHNAPVKSDFLKSCFEAIEDKKHLSCPRLSEQQIKKILIDNPNLKAYLCPPTLQRVEFGQSSGANNVGNILLRANNVTHLNAEQADILILDGPFIGATCLKHLSLAGSALDILNPDILANMPSLQYVNISNCPTTTASRGSQLSLIRNMTKLRTLDLSGNEIRGQFISSLDKNAPNLERLYLQNNQLNRIPQGMPHSLRLLDLRFNYLTTLIKEDMDSLERLSQRSPSVQVLLGENPFDCQCSQTTYSFIDWFQSTTVNITSREAVTCTVADSSGKQYQRAVSHISKTWFQLKCNKDVLLGVGTALISVVVVCVAVKIIYRKRWLLRYTWYRLREACFEKRSRQPFDERENERSVYIISIADGSYHDTEEYKFVYNYLGNKVTGWGIKPIYHMKQTVDHFVPGRPCECSIYKAVSESSKSILVLTPTMFDDVNTEWLIMAMNLVMVKPLGFLTIIDFKRPELNVLMDRSAGVIGRALVLNRALEWSENASAEPPFSENLNQKLSLF